MSARRRVATSIEGERVSTRTQRSLQVAVVVLGVFCFVTNVVDGVGVWDFLPLIAFAGALFAIEQASRNQDRGL